MRNLAFNKRIVLILLMKTTFVFSQEGWISEIPQGYLNDYFVGSGSSTFSETEAEKIAYRDALDRISDSRLIIFESSTDTMIQYNPNIRKEGGIVELKGSSKKTGISSSIKGFKIWNKHSKNENGRFSVKILVSIPKEYPIPPPSPFSPIWRSFILPSWGQFYKGESVKGYFIAGGTVAFLTSGFIFSNLKITAESDAKNSRTQTLRDYYNDNTNKYNNISLACFIVTAALYVYNVIDAIAAEGEKKYVYEPQNRNYELKINQTMCPKTQNLFCMKLIF